MLGYLTVKKKKAVGQCAGNITEDLQKDTAMDISFLTPYVFSLFSFSLLFTELIRRISSIFHLSLISIHIQYVHAFFKAFIYLLPIQLWPNGNNYIHSFPNSLSVLHSLLVQALDHTKTITKHTFTMSPRVQVNTHLLSMPYKLVQLNFNDRKSPEGHI